MVDIPLDDGDVNQVKSFIANKIMTYRLSRFDYNDSVEPQTSQMESSEWHCKQHAAIYAVADG